MNRIIKNRIYILKIDLLTYIFKSINCVIYDNEYEDLIDYVTFGDTKIDICNNYSYIEMEIDDQLEEDLEKELNNEMSCL